VTFAVEAPEADATRMTEQLWADGGSAWRN
jgi:hypothetical protein